MLHSYVKLKANILSENELFQQDRPPPHILREVPSLRTDLLLISWINRYSSIEYLPRSADLGTPNVFLRKLVEDKVFATDVSNKT